MEEQCYTNTNSNLNPTANPVGSDNNDRYIDYFLPDLNKDVDREASAKLSNCSMNLQTFFSGIGCFEGIFSLQVK